MVDTNEVLNKISVKSPSGRHCVFVEIGNIGVKCYVSRKMRDRCFDFQKRMADEFDCAPKAYEKLRIGIYHCYTTEIAEQLEFDDAQIYSPAIKAFADITGYWFGDCCYFNFGYIKRRGEDVLVPIDLDPVEFNGFTSAEYEQWENDDANCSPDIKEILLDIAGI